MDDDDSDAEYELPPELIAAGHTMESLSAMSPEEFEAEMKRLNVKLEPNSDDDDEGANDDDDDDGDDSLFDGSQGKPLSGKQSRFEATRNADEARHMARLVGGASGAGGDDDDAAGSDSDGDLEALMGSDFSDGDDVALPDDPEQLERLLASLEREYVEGRAGAGAAAAAGGTGAGGVLKGSGGVRSVPRSGAVREAEWEEAASDGAGKSKPRRR